MACMNGGRPEGTRILNEATVKAIVTDQRLEGIPGQGLAWVTLRAESGRVLWGRGGSDPGAFMITGPLRGGKICDLGTLTMEL